MTYFCMHYPIIYVLYFNKIRTTSIKHNCAIYQLNASCVCSCAQNCVKYFLLILIQVLIKPIENDKNAFYVKLGCMYLMANIVLELVEPYTGHVAVLSC